MNKEKRIRILDRDGHRCKLGPHEDDTKRLDVHHFHDLVPGMGYVNAYDKEDEQDLVTLCRACHGALKTAGRSRKRWSLRRKLTLIMYGIEIGPCQMHTFVHARDGVTRCMYCPATLPAKTEAKPCTHIPAS